MPQTDIRSSDTTDLTNSVVDYSVGAESTDAGGDTKEFTYQNAKWSKWLGYYKSIPELKIAVDTKANWVIGNGFQSDEVTEMLLSAIKGNGKDTFNSILENMERTCYIGEDAYSEVIRDNDDVLVNLKPLDPSSIVVVHNNKGRVIRYEQTTKTKRPNKKFKPEEIFVLSHNRLADEIHGISIIPAVENVILARNEAMDDWKRVLHRNVDPLWVYHLDTDDTTEISNWKTKLDTARKNSENMIVPKGVVVPELISTATNASLNPLTWINQLNDYFFQAVGVPQIIVGNAKSFTDASGKIVYLAFEQRIRGRQKYVEEQILAQLNIEIELTFPASLQQDTVSDQPSMELEEEPQEPAAQPNDTKTELEGKK
jgi:hypothetical protein